MNREDAVTNDITLKRGDTLPLTLWVTQAVASFSYEDDVPRNIDGSTTTLTARHGYNGTAVFTVNGVIADADSGKVVITITPANTLALVAPCVLVYDIQYSEGDALVVTLESGKLTVLPDVVR